MNIPEIFKYNSLISVPLFSIVALFLIRKAPNFSLRKHTVSKTINLLNHPVQAIIFRTNFIIKALLDLGFELYVLKHFNIPLESIIALMLILSTFLFGTLAYFIEGKYAAIHRIIVYFGGVLWVLGEISVVRLIGNSSFFLFSIISLFVPIVLAYGFLFTKKTNVFVQALCMFIWYIWLLIFVFQYL